MPEKKASVSFDALMRQLKNGEFAPVYLLMGDETYYIDKLSSFSKTKFSRPSNRLLISLWSLVLMLMLHR